MISLAEPEAADAEVLDVTLHALADRTRRGLLALVRHKEWSAGELADQFPGMSRPAVSQHLRILHDAGLVTVRPEGNRRMYGARVEGLDAVRHYIDAFWTDHLARLKAAAEQLERDRRDGGAHP